MDRIDTHLHLLHPDRFRYEWSAGIPALSGDDLRLADYHAAAAGCGIGSPCEGQTSAGFSSARRARE